MSFLFPLRFVFVVVVRRLHPHRVLAADAEDAAGRLHFVGQLLLFLLNRLQGFLKWHAVNGELFLLLLLPEFGSDDANLFNDNGPQLQDDLLEDGAEHVRAGGLVFQLLLQRLGDQHLQHKNDIGSRAG